MPKISIPPFTELTSDRGAAKCRIQGLSSKDRLTQQSYAGAQGQKLEVTNIITVYDDLPLKDGDLVTVHEKSYRIVKNGVETVDNGMRLMVSRVAS